VEERGRILKDDEIRDIFYGFRERLWIYDDK
jgi:hypothetical protein